MSSNGTAGLYQTSGKGLYQTGLHQTGRIFKSKISASSLKSQILISQKNQVFKATGIILLAVAAIGALSGISYHMSYSSATKSLEVLGSEFMENVPFYLEASLQKRLDPLRLHMKSGLRMLHANGANVKTWDGISQIRKYTTSFLLAFFEENKCCFGVFANMGLAKEDVAPYGSWQGWLDNHENDYGSDQAIFDNVLVDADEKGALTLTAWENEHRSGNLSNPTIATSLSTKTIEPLAPLAESTNYGFISWPWWDGYTPDHDPLSGWWRTVHRFDLQPGEFRFTPVFVWKDTAPYCLKVMGVVPMYENTEVPNDDELARIKAGTVQWNGGQRVGAWVVGFKLWFLSAHLAGMNLKGGFLFLVDRQTGILVAASDTSVPLLTNPTDYDNVKAIRVHDTPHRLIQEAVKQLAPENNWNGIRHELQEVQLQDKAQFMLTFSFLFYGLDFVGVYIVPRDSLLEDLDNSSAENAIFGIVVNTVFAGSLLLVVMYRGFSTFKRLQQVALEQDRSIRQRVAEGVNSVSEIGFPMVLTAALVFQSMPLTEVQKCHENARDTGKLVFLDSMEQIKAFRDRGKRIIFYSYQWLSWKKSGPNQVQHELMLKCPKLSADKMGVPPESVHVWLDVLSIPQDHEGIKVLAVNSLYVYATAVDHLIIVAPESKHENTNAVANLDSYRERAWTRTEQTAHASIQGTSNMYIAKPDLLEDVSEDWVSDVVSIFKGEMTCCRLKHKYQDKCDKESLITPLLGVWYTVLLGQSGPAQNTGAQLLHKIMSEEKDVYFPPTFEFLTEDRSETRVLFGSMLKYVETLATEKTNAEIEDDAKNSVQMSAGQITAPVDCTDHDSEKTDAEIEDNAKNSVQMSAGKITAPVDKTVDLEI